MVFSCIWKHYESRQMKHEKNQWKCFVPDTPSFCDHIWSRVELFSETFHIRWCRSIWKSPITAHSLDLVVVLKSLKFKKDDIVIGNVVSTLNWIRPVFLFNISNYQIKQELKIFQSRVHTRNQYSWELFCWILKCVVITHYLHQLFDNT